MTRAEFCEQFIATLSKGDFEGLAPMLDPEFCLHEAAGLPYGGEFRGVEGWRELSKAIVANWSGFRLKLLEYVCENENALVVRFGLSGKSRKTGKPFETTVMELWRFRDGRLHEVLPYYWDTQLLASINA